MQFRTLRNDEIEHFLTYGYIVLDDCFDLDIARRLMNLAFARLGYDRQDPSTWQKSRIYMPRSWSAEVKDFAPRAWHAVCELVGGAERIVQPYTWGDGFVLNLFDGADEPWHPPFKDSDKWHKDGYFRHFLDSPELGLIAFVLWSDVEHRGGGTFLATDSIPTVAHYLVEHPEGVQPNDFGHLIQYCHQIIELTGRSGDVILVHPFMLHAPSANALRIPRFLTNPPLALRKPMRFDRSDPNEISLVELAVLRALSVERLSFQALGVRERIVPDTGIHQESMRKQISSMKEQPR